MPTVAGAFIFLETAGPGIFGNVGSMLYVGHRKDTSQWWWRTFAPAIGAERLAVIDIVKENLLTAGSITGELYLGDIRQEDSPRDFGLVFWDEGPEHMPREDALRTITWLAERNRRVLVSCPWGFQPQGKDRDDPEFHHWGPTAEDMVGIGMTVRTFGERFENGFGHGNLLAWMP